MSAAGSAGVEARRPDPQAAARVLLERSGIRPVFHLVLGSGLGGLAQRVRDPVRVGFGELPRYPRTSVEGHEGAFVAGRIAGVPVLVQSGRVHFYEGFGADVVLLPVRTGRAAGAEVVIVTNAAGGIREDLVPGAVMLIDDHIGAMFRSPLAGPSAPGEARFPDQSRPYDPELAARAEGVALEAGIRLPRGVYAAVHGPSFETPAEIRALRAAGADAVGMSTVPEAIAARAGGQRVLAFSAITNRAAGLGLNALDHDEVMVHGAAAGRLLATVIEGVVAAGA